MGGVADAHGSEGDSPPGQLSSHWPITDQETLFQPQPKCFLSETFPVLRETLAV